MLQELDYIPTPWGNAEKYGNGGGGISLDSPAFTGIPTAPTAAAGTNSTQLATTEFVTYAITVSGNNLSSHISNTVAHGATALNTASRIVLRDNSGNFSAGTITANLTGNASSADKLATARKINGVDFDGTADISISTGGSVTIGTTLISLGSSSLTLEGLTSITATTFSGSLTGNASSADKLTTARKINGVDFDGTADISIPINGTITIGTTLISLGSSSLTLKGLTSVTATTFSGSLTGNASSADKLSTARKINGVDFDGTADISISVSTSWADISGKPSLFTGVIDVNGFYCLTDPNGSSTNYIRTTSYGLIPYTSGGSGTLGTPSWPFSTIYANNLYGNLNGGTTAPTVLVLPTAASATNYAIWIS